MLQNPLFEIQQLLVNNKLGGDLGIFLEASQVRQFNDLIGQKDLTRPLTMHELSGVLDEKQLTAYKKLTAGMDTQPLPEIKTFSLRSSESWLEKHSRTAVEPSLARQAFAQGALFLGGWTAIDGVVGLISPRKEEIIENGEVVGTKAIDTKANVAKLVIGSAAIAGGLFSLVGMSKSAHSL